MDSNIIAQVAAATMFAKAGVDFIKKSAISSPSWILPILALAIGEGAAFLLLIYSGIILTSQSAAGAGLAGFLAACGAVGVTQLQKSADAEQKRSKEDEKSEASDS
jgi:hypothetical protein